MDILLLADIPAPIRDRVRSIAPHARFVRADPDDAAYRAAIESAEVVVGDPPCEDLPRARALRWLQLTSAGVEPYLDAVPASVLLTNAKGAYDVPVAEHALAMMLALSRGLTAAGTARRGGSWRPPFDRRELQGATCGIVGLGSIGREIAVRAKAFGMRLLAVKRHPGSKPPYVDELFDGGGLEYVLGEADHLVLALPLTADTRGMFGPERFRQMKAGACLYNVGRGGVVVEDALVAALRDGRLAGAGLDVFEVEPLPEESPLWEMPGVLLSPHVAALSPAIAGRMAEIFANNLQRYVDGQPLRNAVGRDRGY